LGLPTDYDRTCAGILKEESDDRASKGELHTVRLKVPSLYPQYTDLVYGKVGAVQGKTTNPKAVTYKYGEQVYEDPILIKSDGLPTYHLANVVDDHLMEITHVIRAVVCRLEPCILKNLTVLRNGCPLHLNTWPYTKPLDGTLLLLLMSASCRTNMDAS
jgi:hypothetical protein